jgi:acetyl esterase/lipase
MPALPAGCADEVRRPTRGACVLAVLALTTACGRDAAPTSSSSVTATTAQADAHLVESNTINGLAVDVYANELTSDHPVVVLFHGGGWLGGDPSSIARLAEALGTRGLVVFNSAYRTGDGGFPASFEDVECALRYAADRADEWSTVSDAIWVVGHSAGAHLAAVAALAGEGFDGSCPLEDRPPVSRFAGLAGPYDPTLYDMVLAGYFGARLADDPERWARGSPYTYLGENPDLVWLLAHGADDDLVPPAASELFYSALIEHGYQANLEILPEATHLDSAEPALVGDLVYQFLTG